MAEQSTAPPYGEEEATRWLAWLAYQMRERDMTVFEVESLQPDWLAGLSEIASHVLLTRGLLGIVCILFRSPISHLIYHVTFYRAQMDGYSSLVQIPNLTISYLVSLILIDGLIPGLIIGLSEVVIPIHKIDVWLSSRNSSAGNLLIGTIAHGLLFGLISSLMFSRMADLTISLMIGSGYGLVFGYIRTSRITQRSVGSHICTVDSLKWSWKQVGYNAKKGLLFGLLFGLIQGLPLTLLSSLFPSHTHILNVSLNDRLIGSLIIGLMEGLINGIVLGSVLTWISVLIGGFQPAPLSMKTHPNQGIWLTLRSILKLSLPAGVLVGILIWLLTSDIEAGLAYSLIVSFAIGLWYGGLDVIEHAIIRLIIARRGHAPLNYACFLDYAANDLNFLQKVGGGYIFIHRYLLEHFAEIAVEQGYVDVNARRHPQSF